MPPTQNGSITASEFVATMTPEQVVHAYVAQNLHVVMGEKVHLHEIRKHFADTSEIPEDILGMEGFKRLLKHTIMNMPPDWGDIVVYKKFMIDSHNAQGYLNLAWTHAADTPRFDATNVVRDYVRRHLGKQSGSNTSQHDIYQHFMGTVQGSGKRINAPNFYKVLKLAVDSILGTETPIQHEKLRLNGTDRCMRFVGVGFVDAGAVDVGAVARPPSPQNATQKYRLCVCVCVCGREGMRKRERERESEREGQKQDKKKKHA